jgi:uncharacterized protein YidB (DUF937 family)
MKQSKRKLIASCTLAASMVVAGAMYGPALAQAGVMKLAAGVMGQGYGYTAGKISEHGHEDGHQDKERRHRGGFREVAKLLGLSTDELKTALKDGKTMADIAKERGIDRQKVVDLIADRMQERLDARLKDGDVTQEEYTARKARIPELAARIVDEGMPRSKGPHGGRHPAVKPEPAEQPQQSH